MKRIFIMFFIILSCLLIVDMIYQSNKTETVLLSGTLMGFEIEVSNEDKQEGDLIPTSAQKLGIVTFVKKGTHEFAALGHSAISNIEKSNINGICHEINVEEIEKSTKNHIGHIYGTLENEEQIGIVNKNSKYGIFGTINEVDEDEHNEINTASRYEIVAGEAELLMCLDNKELQSYKIEIQEINYISDNKNIKVKILDDHLISLTGGIVQGMSGAPIVQNGKLVGAINYADAKVPEEAYAIFIDKLI